MLAGVDSILTQIVPKLAFTCEELHIKRGDRSDHLSSKHHKGMSGHKTKLQKKISLLNVVECCKMFGHRKDFRQMSHLYTADLSAISLVII